MIGELAPTVVNGIVALGALALGFGAPGLGLLALDRFDEWQERRSGRSDRRR